MKTFVIIAVAVSLYAPSANAAGALEALRTSAGADAVTAAAAVPAAAPAEAAPALGAGVSDMDAAHADALAASARSNGFAVFELDGSKMTTKPALMAYSAQALGLPADMDNWDAMIDYLGDMPTFHRNNRILIVVRNAAAIYGADNKLYSELRDVAELSCENADSWSRSTATLKFVFVK